MGTIGKCLLILGIFLIGVLAIWLTLIDTTTTIVELELDRVVLPVEDRRVTPVIQYGSVEGVYRIVKWDTSGDIWVRAKMGEWVRPGTDGFMVGETFPTYREAHEAWLDVVDDFVKGFPRRELLLSHELWETIYR